LTAEEVLGAVVVDKSRLQIIGWLLGGMTFAVMVVAALLVGDAVASNVGATSAQTVTSGLTE
jgi:dolichol kinase